MKNELDTKNELIEDIRKKDAVFSETDFTNYSVTQLIIIRATIDAKINHGRQKETNFEESE